IPILTIPSILLRLIGLSAHCLMVPRSLMAISLTYGLLLVSTLIYPSRVIGVSSIQPRRGPRISDGEERHPQGQLRSYIWAGRSLRGRSIRGQVAHSLRTAP